MLPSDRNQRFAKQGTMLAADAVLTLITGVSGQTIAIVDGIITCLVPAAQGVYLGDQSGTVKALSLATSFGTTCQAIFRSSEGLRLTPGEALVLKPASAGPSMHVSVSGYYEKSAALLATTT